MIRTLERKSTPPRVRRRALSISAEFDSDPIIWAAWLHNEESMTQEEVAHQFCVSRASVVNFLHETPDGNIVTIVVSSPRLRTIDAILSGNYATELATDEVTAGALVSRAVRLPRNGASRRH